MAAKSKAEILATQHKDELFLRENPARWVILPIHYHDVWNMFKKIEESFWTPEDVNYSENKENLSTLPDAVVAKLRQLTAFNAISYRKVYDIEAATLDLLCTIQSPEARGFYSFQIAFETFHIEVYNYILESLMNHDLGHGEEIPKMCQSIFQLPSVAQKRAWFAKYVSGNSRPFVEKVLALAIVKRLFTSANILVRGWLEQEKCDLPGLSKGYELVDRDLLIHAEFSALCYNSCENKLKLEDVKVMATEACECEIQFLKDFIPLDNFKLSESDLGSYVRWMMDEILVDTKFDRLFDTNKHTPISFVDISKDKNTNQPGETRGTARYSAKEQMNLLEKWRCGVRSGLSPEDSHDAVFSLDEDF